MMLLRQCAHCFLSLIAIVPAAWAARAEQSTGGEKLADRYADAARRIIAATEAENGGYRKLEELCDDIGHRLSGSIGLERAVEWAESTLKREGHDNVRTQPVMVPKWVRGDESLEMVEPRRVAMPLLGLGGTVGTPPEGITAPVVVVHDEAELRALPDDAVKGRIVLFNHAMPKFDAEKGTGYGSTVQYRVHGARWAESRGAVAALIRSVTARSLRSPHTGAMNYADARAKIPTAAITTEDADKLSRLQKRGIPVVLSLKMGARNEGLAPSANVIAEIRGSERPEEIVVIGGHLDSWDVGQGAQDDGAGVAICMDALNVIRKLKLTPRRTIRLVLFTNEENGLAGGKAYAKEHADQMGKHVAAIESDSGCFAPRGFSVSHKDDDREKRAVTQLRELVALLDPLGAARATDGGGGADIGPMKEHGVPLLGHEVDNATYFDYHHTQADTFDKIDPQHMANNVAAMAIMAYVLADMPGRLGEP